MLDAHKPHLEERLRMRVWMHVCCSASCASAARRADTRFGLTGCDRSLRAKPGVGAKRKAAGAMAVRRFEAAAGQETQVDSGHLAASW